MAGYEQRLRLFAIPANPVDAKKIEQALTMESGSHGFELIEVVNLGGSLLVVMQKPIP